MIYLDNAATTSLEPECFNAMIPYMQDKYANPSGVYKTAKECRYAVENVRKNIAMNINADRRCIYFTSGGTESDNWAIKMAAAEYRQKNKEGGHIITSAIEHHAVINTCEYLKLWGFDITYISVDKRGIVNVEELKASIRSDTFLISIMMANNEVGTIQPIDSIAYIARNAGILFHTDAVQAFGHIPIDVRRSRIDMMSVSAHKFNGPKGVGFLYISKDSLNTPLVHGGGQESGFRSGTENTAGIVGMGKAADIAVRTMKQRMNMERMLRNYMIARVKREIPDAVLNGDAYERLSNNVNFCFPGVDGAAMVVMLDKDGICASAGSACSSGSKEGSYVLRAMGLNEEMSHSAVRFTLNSKVTSKEIDFTIKCLKKNVAEMRSLL